MQAAVMLHSPSCCTCLCVCVYVCVCVLRMRERDSEYTLERCGIIKQYSPTSTVISYSCQQSDHEWTARVWGLVSGLPCGGRLCERYHYGTDSGQLTAESRHSPRGSRPSATAAVHHVAMCFVSADV